MIKYSIVQTDTKMDKSLVNKPGKRKNFSLIVQIILWMASQVRSIETKHLFSHFNKYSSNTKKRKQPYPRSMKILNVDEPCRSKNFGITEIVFESNITKPLIKNQETMTDDY